MIQIAPGISISFASMKRRAGPVHKFLKQRGILTRFITFYKHPYLQGYCDIKLDGAENTIGVPSIPIFPELSSDDQEKIIQKKISKYWRYKDGGRIFTSQKRVFHMEISISSIRMSDAESERIWRNDQIDALRQSQYLSSAAQKKYFEKVIKAEFPKLTQVFISSVYSQQ